MSCYQSQVNRYEKMLYRRCGRSGIMLPALSVGLWHGFGERDDEQEAKKMLLNAFDAGITHFDLANNYGPAPGAAESFLGNMLRNEFKAYRDELLISTKAGFKMWEGPYGEWGSKKHILSSLDQSLKRLGLDYVDIFYSHRPDKSTPLDETMGALQMAVQQGKALYVGISSYSPNMTMQSVKILKKWGLKCLLSQVQYSLLDRDIEESLLGTLNKFDMGCVAFSPLKQGLLTGKYLKEIPVNSRLNRKGTHLHERELKEAVHKKVEGLMEIAKKRGQTLSQMSLAWALQRVSSVIMGLHQHSQLIENLECLKNLNFTKDEIKEIDAITKPDLS